MHITKGDTFYPVRKLACGHYHTKIDGISFCGITQGDLAKNVKRLFPEVECGTVKTAIIKDSIKMGRIYARKIQGGSK